MSFQFCTAGLANFNPQEGNMIS